MPESKDVDEALGGVLNFLTDPKMHKEYAPPLRAAMAEIKKVFSDYRVQMVGITVDGKKYIHCNFLSDMAIPDDWRENYFSVEDGGYNFWRIDYDMDLKKCVNFESNGPLF